MHINPLIKVGCNRCYGAVVGSILLPLPYRKVIRDQFVNCRICDYNHHRSISLPIFPIPVLKRHQNLPIVTSDYIVLREPHIQTPLFACSIVGTTNKGLKSPNGHDISNLAIIEVKIILYFRPETIELTSIIARLVTSRPFGDLVWTV